jgi:hypothetical protein
MTTYKKTKSIVSETELIVSSDGKWIPADPLNPDYLAYVAWLFEGNTPEEWQPLSEPVIEETPADSTEEEPVTEDGN